MAPEKILEKMIELLVEEASAQQLRPRMGSWLAPAMPGLLEIAPNAPPQFLAQHLVESQKAEQKPDKRLLDFGCGSAPHRALLKQYGFQWTGLDLRDSTDPAALARVEGPTPEKVALYDGSALPFGDQSFGVIWSYQSFEHVPNAEASMSECARVLCTGGLFSGSVSFLEPYHARSTFSYTPYGFHQLCERHGLKTVKIFIRNDGISLALRTFLSMLGFESQWNALMERGGIFGRALHRVAEDAGITPSLADAVGAIAGHFLFIARKTP